MPTGPAGVQRPLASCELILEAHYNVDAAYGQRLEDDSSRYHAERMIAQHIDDDTTFHEPSVELSTAGSGMAVKVALGDEEIRAPGWAHNSLDSIEEACMDAVQSAIDQNASHSVTGPEWTIYTR